jgi:tRNA (cytidine/uridine-2'-O-)-methyltransferase
MRLAIYAPDIAQNTGTMLRLAACLGVGVDLIAPAAFDMTDRAFRRAALDYLDAVTLQRHESFTAFNQDRRGRLVLLTTHGAIPHTQFAFQPSDIVMVGRESGGVPQAIHDRADARLKVPMRPPLRSLNVAVTAAIVLGEALRQTGGYPVS